LPPYHSSELAAAGIEVIGPEQAFEEMGSVASGPADPEGEIIDKPDDQNDREEGNAENLRHNDRADADREDIQHREILKITDGPVQLPAVGKGHGLALLRL
jgi:hypothetical protein